jgi:anti-sigma B factor antagonist
MEVSVAEKGDVTVVTVKGRIDSSNAKEFDTPLMDVVQKGKTKIVLDMGGVEYMSSIGLRTIISGMKSLKEKGGTLKLANLTNNVRGMLLVMGTELFDVHDTVDQAVASF